MKTGQTKKTLKTLTKGSAVVAVSSMLLFCSGCGNQPIIATVVKVTQGNGKNAHFYVHRDAHTLIEFNGRRAVVPGDLGKNGDKIELREVPSASLYW